MTENLAVHLAAGATSGLFRLEGRTSAKTLARLADAAGWQFLHLDAGQVTHKAGFLSAAAETLQFPRWAGRNWDAFEELVNDLAWLPLAPGYLVLLDRLGKFSAGEPSNMRTALEILETAAANRADGQPPLVVLVRGGRAAAKHLAGLTVGPS